LSDWKDTYCLEVLAGAYSEAGDFKEAVKWEKKAMDLAPEDSKQHFMDRLRWYEAGKGAASLPPPEK
jgi:serine/threonine-protein kinase